MTDWEKFTFEAAPSIRVGISSCLLGEAVRYNGGHAHDSFVTTILGPFVEWIPICPEMDIGMGTPREAIRLVRANGEVRLIGQQSDTDYTDRMQEYARDRTEKLASSPLHGYILKKDSPSCGMERVRLYDKNGVASRNGTGMFAEQLKHRFPLLPIEEEGRLRDIALRENFIERLFAFYRLQQFLGGQPGPGDLVEYHTRHKLTFLSHHQERYRELGRLVSEAGGREFPALLQDYSEQFMQTLEIHATRKNHANVLHHILGYFKDSLESGDKQEMVAVIDDYRRGLLPLIVPMTLLTHHLRRHPVDWLAKQVYLHPYPPELKLRNLI